MKSRSKFLKIFTSFLGFWIAGIPGNLMAQSAKGLTQADVEWYLNLILIFIIVVAVLVMLVAFFTYRVLTVIMAVPEKETSRVEEEEAETVWTNLNTALTKAVPVEEEDKIMLDHEYDGIRELDNHLPPWWLWLFYGTIAFSVIYLFVYHVIGVAPLMEQEYEQEMAIAAEQLAERQLVASASIDETNVVFQTDQANLDNGQKLYIQMCAVCHKPDGGGSVGPNLTDEYWLHGGTINDIFKTIKYGVPEKGMISWESQLKPDQMQDLSSFILSIQGTNPPNAKEPQGEKVAPEQKAEVPEATNEKEKV